MTEALIRTENLRREFGATVAVRDVNLCVEPGAVLALVGPNGAGKTTLLKLISGLLEPTRGTAWVNGLNIRSHPRQVHQLLGFLPDFFGLYEDLKVWEYLDYFARAYRLATGERHERIHQSLVQVDLVDQRDTDIHVLSRGMRQRLAIARTLIQQPPLLLLDEPAAGLDPESRHHLQTLFTQLSRLGKTLVVSSHILSELEDYCTHVAMLQEGRLIASGSIQEVRKGLGVGRLVRVAVLGNHDKADAILRGHGAIAGVTQDAGQYVFQFQGDDAELAKLLEHLVVAGVPVTLFGEERRTIEDTYLRLTKRQQST